VQDTIEEETGEGLLLNDPLVMSMYQSSPTKNQTPDSSPDSSPVRVAADPPAEESLSDKEFEQMEAKAAAVSPVHSRITQTSEFRDFGHPNLMDDVLDEYQINKDDPFQTPAKATTTTTTSAKSSYEDEYEVIPQTAADVSNLMGLSPERSFAPDTTIIEADPSVRPSVSPVMRDADEKFPPAPSPEPPVQQPAVAAAAAPPVAVSSLTTSGAEAGNEQDDGDDDDDESVRRDTQLQHVLSAPPETRIPDTQPEPHPVSAVPLLTAVPKKTDDDYDQTHTAKQTHQSPAAQRNTVSMASADSSSSGCPFTAGESVQIPVPLPNRFCAFPFYRMT
jgi:hypothetical protein